MFNSLIKVCLLITLGTFLMGCMSSGNPILLEQSIQDSITVGSTTKEDVRASLGVPSVITVTELNGQKREAWGYSYTNVQTNPLLWVPVVGLIVLMCCETTTVEYRSLGLSFSQDGVVRSKVTLRGDINALIAQMTSQTEVRVD